MSETYICCPTCGSRHVVRTDTVEYCQEPNRPNGWQRFEDAAGGMTYNCSSCGDGPWVSAPLRMTQHEAGVVATMYIARFQHPTSPILIAALLDRVSGWDLFDEWSGGDVVDMEEMFDDIAAKIGLDATRGLLWGACETAWTPESRRAKTED